ncbi:hypothetical protein BT96DRAFT_421615 [Gymnopus androsaceus JB14]|uniref:Uncharacterized protein n=1 Tax=Gymnopus androsaceus JB14 TaxID=1447944 RepID=A0A6A4GTY2_9AGAR|nr:hypothetical protein BT96DRAFT_421615 [Gymnopus androsaceus JB14]
MPYPSTHSGRYCNCSLKPFPTSFWLACPEIRTDIRCVCQEIISSLNMNLISFQALEIHRSMKHRMLRTNLFSSLFKNTITILILFVLLDIEYHWRIAFSFFLSPTPTYLQY